MIFAAGLGTRLKPLTDDRPKALVEVAGKPLLAHVIERVRDAGASRVVVNVHHFADMVIDYLNHHDFGVEIVISDERDLLLDTGGGILKAFQDGLFEKRKEERGKSNVDSKEERVKSNVDCEPILIHNVDIVSDINLKSLADSQPRGTILCVARRDTTRYLLFDERHCMRGWLNKKTGELKVSCAINDLSVLQNSSQWQQFAFQGIHIIDKDIYPLLQEYSEDNGKVFSITNFYIEACGQTPIHAFDTTGIPWVDCGKLESLPLAEQIIN